MIVVALIVAAGRGNRAGPGAPKQYRLLDGEPVLRRTLAAFAGHSGIDAVLTVIHPDDRTDYEAAAADLPKLLPACMGGDTRQASVRSGLEALAATRPTHVLIHDGARPFVSSRLISACIDALATHRGVLVALPVTDTLRRAANGLADGTVSREGLWRAQTPQGFEFEAILKAHRQADRQSATDDVEIATMAGIEVSMIEGDEDNLKITSHTDMARAARIAARGGEVRTGSGFDVHRFGPGDHVWLCGVRVPHSAGLVGHSDADVGLHALTDSILGAIGAGDIGKHFPPDEAKWEGAASDIFLAHAGNLAARAGARIANLDVTLICERPKIGPHAEAMRDRIAEILDIERTRVSVKATTTEGLGFTGRSEGIAAQALATLIFG